MDDLPELLVGGGVASSGLALTLYILLRAAPHFARAFELLAEARARAADHQRQVYEDARADLQAVVQEAQAEREHLVADVADARAQRDACLRRCAVLEQQAAIDRGENMRRERALRDEIEATQAAIAAMR